MYGLSFNKQRLQALGSLSVDELRDIFRQFDTSGDGSLDPSELKCALKVAVGVEVSVADAIKLVEQADKDGNGVVDFGEFQGICKMKAQ